MHADRLTKLADFLETSVEETNFKMYTWGEKWHCGTTYCACGWATQIFWDEGFRGEWVRDTGILWINYTSDEGSFEGWEAVREFFDLDVKESHHLFLDEKYDTPSKTNVVERIRNFVKNGGIS